MMQMSVSVMSTELHASHMAQACLFGVQLQLYWSKTWIGKSPPTQVRPTSTCSPAHNTHDCCVQVPSHGTSVPRYLVMAPATRRQELLHLHTRSILRLARSWRRRTRGESVSESSPLEPSLSSLWVSLSLSSPEEPSASSSET